MNMSHKLKVLFGAFALTCVGSLYGEITTNEMANADWGYEIHGIGEKGDEVALVFTNALDKTMTWKPGLDIQGVRYLIVGGGGAGGSGYAGSARSNTVPDMGGGGGGAGAGFEGMVDVSATDEIPVVVGAGGIGAASSQGGDGGDSSIEVGEQKIVAAGGGGGGRAINDKNLDDSLAAGRVGGCGGGGTVNGKGQKSPKSTQQGGASLDELHGKAGGNGYVYTSNYMLCYGGGGGGITGAGYAGGGVDNNRVGGAGLASSITGEEIVYGGGGGGGGATATKGGVGGVGGGGAGGVGANGSSMPGLGCGSAGIDGLGGGGGGGSGYSYDSKKTGAFAGGNGGSGVVVIRYAPPAGRVALPEIPSKTYTGATLVADVPPSDGYSVTKNDGGIDVGTYVVTVVPTEGYTWNDGSKDPANVDFKITQAQNEWTVDTPKISKENWLTTDDPGMLTPGATKFGTPTATIAKNGGAAETFEGVLPEGPGSYVITYTVEESRNWIDPDETSRSVSFTIYDGEVVPSFTVEKVSASFVEGDGQVNLSVGYAVHCDVVSGKTVDIYAYYAEDEADTTNEVKIAEGVTLDAVGSGIVSDLKPGVTYWVALGGKGGETVAPMTEFSAVTVPGAAMDLKASATFTNDPMEFIISGSVTPGLGTTTVYLRWSLNTDALDQSAAFPFSYGDAGAFTQKVAYAELTDNLTWEVAVSNSFESTTYGKQTWDDSLPVATKRRFDQDDVTYTWTGNGGDSIWVNMSNWSASNAECYGCPDSPHATVNFTKDAVVDLKGGTFDVKSHQLRVSEDVKVTFKNGTIDEDNDKTATRNLGAAGSVITFENMTYRRNRINPATGSKLVFAGTNVVETTNESDYGIYSPRSVHATTLLVRDGETRFNGFMSTDSNQNIYDNAIIVSNAVLTVSKSKAGVDMRMTVKVYEGQFKLDGSTELNYDGYAFAIPAAGIGGKASFVARNVGENVPKKNLSFTVDASAYDRGRPQPLMKFVGEGYDNGSMTNRTFDLTTIPAEAKSKRNARLEWSAEDNTLYYKQDGKGGIVVIIK